MVGRADARGTKLAFPAGVCDLGRTGVDPLAGGASCDSDACDGAAASAWSAPPELMLGGDLRRPFSMVVGMHRMVVDVTTTGAAAGECGGATAMDAADPRG